MACRCRLVGGGRCGVGQLGPNIAPIVGPQITAAHRTERCQLDAVTALDWHFAHTGGPLPHQLRLSPDGTGERRNLSVARQILGQLHTHMISDALRKKQALRSFLFQSGSISMRQ